MHIGEEGDDARRLHRAGQRVTVAVDAPVVLRTADDEALLALQDIEAQTAAAGQGARRHTITAVTRADLARPGLTAAFCRSSRHLLRRACRCSRYGCCGRGRHGSRCWRSWWLGLRWCGPRRRQ